MVFFISIIKHHKSQGPVAQRKIHTWLLLCQLILRFLTWMDCVVGRRTMARVRVELINYQGDALVASQVTSEIVEIGGG